MEKRVSREREYTYNLNEKNMQDILNLFMNSKYIIMDEKTFVIESPKVKSELHMISTKNFDYSDKPTGSKQRLKIKYKKNGNKFNITYSIKDYIDGKRFESTKQLGTDIACAYNYFCEMSPVEHIIFKYSYEFDIINHLHSSRLFVSIDCCYVVNPKDMQCLSKPYFFIEFEQKEGITLEEFMSAPFFVEFINDKLGTSSHANSKVVISNCFEGKLELYGVNDFNEYISSFYNINLEKIRFLKKITKVEHSLLNLRGLKPTNRGKYIENEFKFITDLSSYEIMDKIKASLPKEWFIIRTQDRIIQDIYFDSNNLELYKNGYSFRIRRRGKGEGWISCLKIPNNEIKEYLQREKIKNAITDEEALLYLTNELPGEGYNIATKFVNNEMMNTAPILYPITYLIQYRERYVIRPYDYSNEQISKMDYAELKKRQFFVRTGDMIHVIFDKIKMYNLINVDMKRLLFLGELDMSHKVLPTKEFFSCEIEFTHRLDLQQAAEDTFKNLISSLDEMGCTQINLDKYRISVEQLGILKKG